jgi:hypothetical protein
MWAAGSPQPGAIEPTTLRNGTVRERLGHHIHGEVWANNIKKVLQKNNLLSKPIHIISANMHSVMNSIYAPLVMEKEFKNKEDYSIFETLSQPENDSLGKKIKLFAEKN